MPAKNSRQMYYHLPKGVFSCVVYEEDEVGHVVEQEEGGEEKLEAPEVWILKENTHKKNNI